MAKVRATARIKPKDSAFLKKARARFKLANDADTQQAERERDDIAFENGEQWPADIQLARKGQQPINGMPAVPARPTLVINKVKEPIRQILNQERAADLGVEIVPADDFGDLGVTIDDTEIRLREGLVRRIQRESHAADARTWAYKRAVIAGRGFYLVMTRFLPGKSWDQEIYLHRIYNQSGVLLDPSHEQPDGSDADWGFVGTWIPWDRYSAEYPQTADGKDNPFSEFSDTDFLGMIEEYPEWYKADGKERAVRVVDYWYVEREARDLALLADGTELWSDELADGVDPIDERTVIQRTIKFCKIGGALQILEETDWAGPDMPIVKVLGDEILPYDNQRRAEGMVRPSRGAQMGSNYMISKLVETIGLTPIPPLVVDPEAIDGYEEWYKVLNTRALPYVPARTFDDQGRQLKEPHKPQADPNIFPMAQGINLFDQFIRSTTAVPDPTLGNVDPSLKSGKSIQALTANAAQSTSNFLDNLGRSIRYEGQIINNLLYPIYGAKPGRIVRILTGDGEAQTIQVGPPPAAPGATPAATPPAMNPRATAAAVLTKDAHFNVIIKVTKSYDSRREQEATNIAALLAADPQLLTWFGDLYFKNSDGPGHMAMADRAKLMLAPPIQQMLAAQESGQAPIPPAVQAALAQKDSQLQQAQQIIAQLSKDAEGNHLKYQATVDSEKLKQEGETTRAQLDHDLQIELQRMKGAATLGAAHIAAEAKGILSAQEAQDEQIATGQQQAHEVQQAALDRQQEQTLAGSQMAHEAALGDVQHDQTMQVAQTPAPPQPDNGQPA